MTAGNDHQEGAPGTKVVVYTTPFCAPCESLKRYLAGRGVAFVVRDLMMDEEAGERLDRLGVRSMPALEVAGQVLSGSALAPEALDRLFGRGER